MPSKFTIYVDDSIQPQQKQQAQSASVSDSQKLPSVGQNQLKTTASNNENVIDQPKRPMLNSEQQNSKTPPRYIPEISKDGRFYFEDWGLYPVIGGEFSFEEIRYRNWKRREHLKREQRKACEYQKENEDLKKQLDLLQQQNSVIVQQNSILLQQVNQIQQQLQTIQQQQQQSQNQQQESGPPTQPVKLNNETTCLPQSVQVDQTMAMDVDYATAHHRLSVVPQSLQNATCLEYTADMSMYGMVNEAPTAVQDLWRATFNQSTIPLAGDKYTNKINASFTVPIDQSQYIKDNVPTSTPASKRQASNNVESNTNENHRRGSLNNRRLSSRPSMGGSPTLKLSPIEETSRECNSKSSSSSSGLSNTPGTAKKPLAPMIEPLPIVMDDRPLDPNDVTTYNQLLRSLPEPVSRRVGYVRVNDSLPAMNPGETCITAQRDDYLVDRILSQEDGIYTANLISDDSADITNDLPFKMFCLKVDQPANEWLFYICNELNRRLVKQKTSPDIELSVMTVNPAIIYNNGSILVDEFLRYVPIEQSFNACKAANKPFPKSVAAYLVLELLQIIRQMHLCDIIHMNIKPKNILITSCLTRDDIEKVGERTSIIKLIGFDRAMDTRLLPQGTKFESTLPDIKCCEMLDGKPWSYELDWYCALNCIHNMFFLKDIVVTKDKPDGPWKVDQTFKGFPTDCWEQLFDCLLNIRDHSSAMKLVDQVIEELNTWIKANTSFVIKESASLEMILDKFK